MPPGKRPDPAPVTDRLHLLLGHICSVASCGREMHERAPDVARQGYVQDGVRAVQIYYAAQTYIQGRLQRYIAREWRCLPFGNKLCCYLRDEDGALGT